MSVWELIVANCLLGVFLFDKLLLLLLSRFSRV